MEKKINEGFIETVKNTYGSLDNFESVCNSYYAFYNKDANQPLDMRRYSTDGTVPVVVASAIYYDGMVDANVYIDGVLRGCVICEEYSNEIMRVYDQLPEKEEPSDDGPVFLKFLSGKLFMASVDTSMITYLMPLDPQKFEEHLRIVVESEDVA